MPAITRLPFFCHTGMQDMLRHRLGGITVESLGSKAPPHNRLEPPPPHCAIDGRLCHQYQHGSRFCCQINAATCPGVPATC